MTRSRNFFLAIALSLAWATGATGQSVEMPAEVKVAVGRLASVTVKWDGDDFGYAAMGDMDCFREYHPDPKVVKLKLIGYTAGRYEVVAFACKGGKMVPEPARCIIIVGTPPPVPPGPVPPGPTPPGPNPPDPPGPIPPAPIPGDGLRFIIIYETADLPKMSKGQLDAMYSPVRAGAVRDYALAKCPKGGRGANTPEFRIWDKDVNAAGDTQVWQDALKRPRSAVPWIIVSNGKTGYEGPMPASADEMLKLLQKYGN